MCNSGFSKIYANFFFFVYLRYFWSIFSLSDETLQETSVLVTSPGDGYVPIVLSVAKVPSGRLTDYRLSREFLDDRIRPERLGHRAHVQRNEKLLSHSEHGRRRVTLRTSGLLLTVPKLITRDNALFRQKSYLFVHLWRDVQIVFSRIRYGQVHDVFPRLAPHVSCELRATAKWVYETKRASTKIKKIKTKNFHDLKCVRAAALLGWSSRARKGRATSFWRTRGAVRTEVWFVPRRLPARTADRAIRKGTSTSRMRRTRL